MLETDEEKSELDPREELAEIHVMIKALYDRQRVIDNETAIIKRVAKKLAGREKRISERIQSLYK